VPQGFGNGREIGRRLEVNQRMLKIGKGHID
jgi:hypothetical protein